MNGTTRITKGLTKVIISGEDNTETELVDKMGMEQALLDAYEVVLT